MRVNGPVAVPLVPVAPVAPNAHVVEHWRTREDSPEVVSRLRECEICGEEYDEYEANVSTTMVKLPTQRLPDPLNF